MDGYQTADGNTQYVDIKRNASTQCVDNRNHTKDHYVPRIKLGILALYLLDKPYYNENIVYLKAHFFIEMPSLSKFSSFVPRE